MMPTAYKIRVPREVVELIRGLHPQLKRKVKASLMSILENPRSGKLLKGELGGLRSVRVSRFRIIYRFIGKKQIAIIAVGPRERVYEETIRLINKE